MKPYLPYRPYLPYLAGAGAGVVADTDAPLLSTVEVGTVGYDTLVVVFTEPVASTDFTLGWTVTVDGAARTIASVTLTAPTTVQIVLATRVYDDQVVTVSYNAAVGTITDLATNDLASFTNTVVTNNVPSLFKFSWYPFDEILISGPYSAEQTFTTEQRINAITLSATQFGAL